MIPIATIKNPDHILTIFKHENKRGRNAAYDAIFRESLRLKNLLRKQIKAGAPGGKMMAPLGPMARMTTKGSSFRKPLFKIAYMMRFYVFWRHNALMAKLGHVPKKGAPDRPKDSKISWDEILSFHARGFYLDVTPKMRKKFIRMAMPSLGRWTGGGRSGGKSFVRKKKRKGTWQKTGRSGSKMYVQNEKQKSPFFVRKNTRLKIPSRPFIEPFWALVKDKAMQNIKQNFSKNMKDIRLNG